MTERLEHIYLCQCAMVIMKLRLLRVICVFNVILRSVCRKISWFVHLEKSLIIDIYFRYRKEMQLYIHLMDPTALYTSSS